MLAMQLPPIIDRYLPWWIAAVIVVLGLFAYGWRDVVRFSFGRAWAIAGVIFAESIRRRVLWITPLAILGCIVVSQLQNPIDEQDAIRQTTKFCLFAAGLLVTVTGIILACTNLPREIESRVIYTVVTKPTTRLEIVVGKVLGFARVSASILLIMGVFTFAFLELKAWRLRNAIVQRLDAGQVEPIYRSTLEHYRDDGLLAARAYDAPDDLSILSRVPAAGDDRRYVFGGGGEGNILVPFALPREIDLTQRDTSPPLQLNVVVNFGYVESDFQTEDEERTRATTLPYLIQNPDATLEQVRVRYQSMPSISVQILDRNQYTLVNPNYINAGKPVALSDPAGIEPTIVPLAIEALPYLASQPVCYVAISANTPGFEYFARVKPNPVFIVSNDGRKIDPLRDPRAPAGREFALPTFTTREASMGRQLRGGSGKVPIAIFKFRDAPMGGGADRREFEMKVGIERVTSVDVEEAPTKVEVQILDRTRPDAKPSNPVLVFPETNRNSFFSVPAADIPGKDFDVLVRLRTNGQYIGVWPTSLRLIGGNEAFAFNLFKSLAILWLLAMLVAIVSVFASTFLSWPIAIVLTILILLGHWGVEQLGDATAPGIGNQVVQDLFRASDPNIARTVSSSVEALTRILNTVSKILPDISQFSALEDLERGVAIPMRRIGDSLAVIGVFGIPMLVLSYVLLRQKEVAP